MVVYESLYHNGVPVAAHQELADEKQTVRLPELKTEALDQDTGSHTGTLRDGAAITDLVNYSNLIPGQEYTLRGQLMVKETGEVLLLEGEPVTAETAFTAEILRERRSWSMSWTAAAWKARQSWFLKNCCWTR